MTDQAPVLPLPPGEGGGEGARQSKCSRTPDAPSPYPLPEGEGTIEGTRYARRGDRGKPVPAGTAGPTSAAPAEQHSEHRQSDHRPGGLGDGAAFGAEGEGSRDSGPGAGGAGLFREGEAVS